MSDERADAIPEVAVEAAGRAICAWENECDERRAADGMMRPASPLLYEDWREEFDGQALAALAAAAPHMAGNREAKRIVAALRSYSDDVDRVRAIGGEVGRISHRLADYIERKFVRAQPDAERAPQPEPRQDKRDGLDRWIDRVAEGVRSTVLGALRLGLLGRSIPRHRGDGRMTPEP